MKILNIVGARPNFMKVAPLHRAFCKNPLIESKIIHTGQHFDAKMSEVFFEQLELPKPHYFLGIGGGTHTEATARTMLEFEKVLTIERPDVVLVVGDVNATLACALVAVKEHIPVVHVEAGLRSGDRKMPEEINRIVVDNISNYLFVTEQDGLDNLQKEGVLDNKVYFVGNVMIDSLAYYLQKSKSLTIMQDLGVQSKGFMLLTMHRPANVDTPEGLGSILEIIEKASEHLSVIFPIHPRTRNNMEKFGLSDKLKSIKNVILTEAQGYLEFLNLMYNAKLIITDSGGIQEESTYLKIPCLTFRDSTERPVTVTLGTNQLLTDLNADTVYEKLLEILAGNTKIGSIPPLWDGKTAQRIADILFSKFKK
jgi:UDP-N-acetylglucosamine 2-epimerase (non-hydrolysing)